MKTGTLSSCSLILFVVFVASATSDVSDECVYTLYVRTGSFIKAGTDSKISATLGDASGKSVWIQDLEKWGLMGLNHDYFERSGIDIFSGRGPCIGSPICRLNLTSDGSGPHHGWFCDFVEITSTGPHTPCVQSLFYVQQWLATDTYPYKLTAVIDGCTTEIGSASGTFVFRPSILDASASV